MSMIYKDFIDVINKQLNHIIELNDELYNLKRYKYIIENPQQYFKSTVLLELIYMYKYKIIERDYKHILKDNLLQSLKNCEDYILI